MDVKNPEFFCNQVRTLKKHGCEVEDFNQAIAILNKINYYKLSAYFLPFKTDNNMYEQGTTLLKIYKIYEFDRKISSFLYGIIQKIEVFIKTQIAYYHSNKYGALGYLDGTTIDPKMITKHLNLISKFYQEVKRNKELPFVKHHIEHYCGKFPLWVAVELFTLGNISQFYSQLKTADKKIIAKSISFITGISCTYTQLASCLYCLTDLRNKCAHFSRIYYTRFSATPNLPQIQREKAFVSGNKYIYLYTYMFILKALYPSPENWQTVITELKALIDEYKDYIEIKHIGFSEEWESLLS